MGYVYQLRYLTLMNLTHRVTSDLLSVTYESTRDHYNRHHNLDTKKQFILKVTQVSSLSGQNDKVTHKRETYQNECILNQGTMSLY